MEVLILVSYAFLVVAVGAIYREVIRISVAVGARPRRVARARRKVAGDA